MLQSYIFKKTLRNYIPESNTHDKKAINDLIYNEKKHLVSKFKDFLILNESCDFLNSYYSLLDSSNLLRKILFCERNTIMMPSYISLSNIKQIMQKNKYKKNKVMKILEMDNDKSIDQINTQLNDKMINSSLVAESMAISQYSERALFLHDKDKISKGCLDFMEKNEINQLFATTTTENDDDNNSKQAKACMKYEKNPKLSKKKRVNGNSNSNHNNQIHNNNKPFSPLKAINQLVQPSTKRNKIGGLSQGFPIKSFRKSSLTLDSHNNNIENDVFVNHNYVIKSNHIAHDKQIPISLRYDNNKKSNKLSSLNNTNANNITNTNLNPTVLRKALRNSINNKLKKSKTFSKNETMEALPLIEKEKQLIQNRIKKQSSPVLKNCKNGTLASNTIKPANKKNLKIETVMQLSQNNKVKHHLSMMKLNPTINNSKNIAITTFNSATTTSRIHPQFNNAKSITVTSTNPIANASNSDNNSKGFQSQKVPIAIKHKNSIQKPNNISLSLSKKIQSLHKRNRGNLEYKLLTVDTNYPPSLIVDIKKNKENKFNYLSAESERRSKTMTYTHFKSPSSSISKKSNIKVLSNINVDIKHNKGNNGISTSMNNNKIVINKRINNNSHQLKNKKNSFVALRKSPLKYIYKKH